MNRLSILVMALLIMASVCLAPVLARTDLGLEWCFTSDDTFYFMMHLEGYDMVAVV